MKLRSLLVGGTALLLACQATPPPVVPTPPPVKPEPPRYVRLPDPSAIPLKEAIPTYRDWLAKDPDASYVVEAITQLAWAGDKASVPVLIKALERPEVSVRVAAARALTELGDETAKTGLQKALSIALDVELPVIVWALVVLDEQTVFDAAVREYAKGELQKVTRLDGDPAFSLSLLVSRISAPRAAKLAASEDILGLVALTRASDTTLPPELVAALAKADKDSWNTLVEAVGEGAGGKSLLLILDLIPKDLPDARFRTQKVFEVLHQAIARQPDTATADALVRYLDSKPEPHWRTKAGLCLADLADLRALPTLAWRMEQDPLKLYDQDKDVQWRMDDNERVLTARALVDLAVLYPDKRPDIRKAAFEPVKKWATTKPQPHDTALRFFAAAEATDALPLLRKWANPTSPLPKAGAQPPVPMDWGTAESALRYLGAMKDAASAKTLETQLARKPAKLDGTTDGLLKNNSAVLGMAVRGVTLGAAQGWSEWGDPRGQAPLVKVIEDPLSHPDARREAGIALGWVAQGFGLSDAVYKIKTSKDLGTKTAYLEALARSPSSAPSLVDLIVPSTDPVIRRGIALALGSMSLPPPTILELRTKLKTADIRTDAALALLLGGNPDTARYVMTAYAKEPGGIDQLAQLEKAYLSSSGPHDFTIESLRRWRANAIAGSHVKIGEGRPVWLRTKLTAFVEQINGDTGPHSWTRTRLRRAKP